MVLDHEKNLLKKKIKLIMKIAKCPDLMIGTNGKPIQNRLKTRFIDVALQNKPGRGLKSLFEDTFRNKHKFHCGILSWLPTMSADFQCAICRLNAKTKYRPEIGKICFVIKFTFTAINVKFVTTENDKARN